MLDTNVVEFNLNSSMASGIFIQGVSYSINFWIYSELIDLKNVESKNSVIYSASKNSMCFLKISYIV